MKILYVMRNIFVVFAFTFFAGGCTHENKQEARQKSLKQFEWLLGSWEYLSEDSLLFREAWEKQNDSIYGGFSFVKKNEDLLTSEIISLLIMDTSVYYIPNVKGQNNDMPVRFLVTASGESGFTCENPEHDFPKKIIYRYFKRSEQDSMSVIISGPAKDGTEYSETFVFLKMKNLK